ncbi:MAG: 2-hydroxyacid dehydrogenase [Rhizobiaceae bacterium]
MSGARREHLLVVGGIHGRVIERAAASFEIVRVGTVAEALANAAELADIRASTSFSVMPAELIDALPALQIVASFGVGYDGVDAVHAARRGVMVTHTPDVLTDEVADVTVALLINTLRELPRAEQWLRQGRWVRDGAYPLTRLTLRGRKAGIFGFGRIGRAIAQRLEAFGIPVAYHNRKPVPGESRRWHPSLVALAAAVDTLICVAPGGAATANAVNAEVLEALGPDGVVINVGRGSSLDEQALAAALGDGRIAAAGLDVFADEPHVPDALLGLANVCLLPHVASASHHTRNAMADLVVDNLLSWFANGTAITPVPETAGLAVTRR